MITQRLGRLSWLLHGVEFLHETRDVFFKQSDLFDLLFKATISLATDLLEVKILMVQDVILRLEHRCMRIQL